MYKILVVEDDKIIHESIYNFLVEDNYAVYSAYDGEEALAMARTLKPDLILMDIMMPRLDGNTALHLLRKENDVPVMIISALSDEETQKQAYVNEADDYVVKPFSMTILLYKISALLKRVYGNDENSIIKYRNILLDQESHEVYRDNEEVVLTASEFDIIVLLLSNPSRIFTREQMIELIWGYDYESYSRTIDQHIKNIRKKLGNEIIITVPRIGYKGGC